MAFGLGPLQRRAQATNDILWLARTDHEAADHRVLLGPDVERADWLADERTWRLRASARAKAFLVRHPRRAAGAWRLLANLQRSVARERLERGLRLLSKGRVVVTDRLHGHILSMLMDIPQVLLDNSYGKLRGFYDAWTASSSNTSFCKTAEDAHEFARLEAEKRRWL
jgi:pyruvyl transferase EpsO